MVDDQLRRIQRTLRELVDFSRPANSETTRCDLHEIVEAALNIAKYYKRKKGKDVRTEFDTGIQPVSLVRDQLVQVILNLILNAMDATEEGQSITIFTERLEDEFGEQNVVRVSDTGSLFAPADQQKIFRPLLYNESDRNRTRSVRLPAHHRIYGRPH